MLDASPKHHALTYCKFDSFKERKEISQNWKIVSTAADSTLGRSLSRKLYGQKRQFPNNLFRTFKELSVGLHPFLQKGVGAVETIALASTACNTVLLKYGMIRNPNRITKRKRSLFE
jgi:hypothetical protein